MIRRPVLVVAVLLAVPVAGRARCPGPGAFQPQTLREVAADSKFVVLVRVENNTKDGGERDTSFLIVRGVLKDHPILAKRPVLRTRFIPINDPKNPPSLLVFGDVFKDEPDLFRGIEGGPALFEYARGLLAVAPKGDVEVLRYCYDFLGSAEAEVANDAFAELSRAAPADVARAASKFDPAKLRRLLSDEKTPDYRLSLYGYLLGHCGARKDAALLRALIDRTLKEGNVLNREGLLVGYTLLDPAEGWALVRKVAGQGENDFPARYATLRTVRFFSTVRPDVIAKQDRLAVVAHFLDQDDIADIAVNDLYEWRCWDLTERVLALSARKIEAVKPRVVYRSVVRYALQCPDPRCKAFVAEQRKKNRELVEQQEELLNDKEGKGKLQ
jgi:hypothetical protein